MDPDYKYESDKDRRLVEDISDKIPTNVHRAAWICKYCDGVYADDPVSSCDCLGADGQPPPHFVEGEIKYLIGASSTPETKCQDLERRLTLAREALEYVAEDSNISCQSYIQQTLASIAPKP